MTDREVCQWHQVDVDGNLWCCTECPAEWALDDGNPFDNKMWFCSECGREINAITFREIDEDGDLIDSILTREEWEAELEKRKGCAT